MKKRKPKPPSPFEVLMFDGKLSAAQARAALDALKYRKFVVLSARNEIAMQASVNQKIKLIIDLMIAGQDIDRRKQHLARLLMESDDDDIDPQSLRSRRNLAQYLLRPLSGGRAGRKARPRLRNNRHQ